MKRLAIIGAGPKGVAIAVKAAVLNGLGRATPQITLFEGKATASAWSGERS